MHFNKGKPYILGGISQGSYGLLIILSEYMLKHPTYYKNMVACYAIASSFSKEFLRKNPHIKMATKDDDVGVVISYNTEADYTEKDNMFLEKDSYCIHPLNWRVDDTYADGSLNLGTYVYEKRYFY